MLPRKRYGKKKIHRMEAILHRRARLYWNRLVGKHYLRIDDIGISNIRSHVLPVFHNGELRRVFIINKLGEQWKVTCHSDETEILISIRSK